MRHLTNIFVNSGNLTGLNEDKNDGVLYLSNSIILPKDKQVYGRILSASVWYDFPNIAPPNNVINFTFQSIPLTLIINPGIYSVRTLQSRISELLFNLVLPMDLIVFSVDKSTRLISLQVNRDSYDFQIDFDTDNYLLKNILGFNLGILTNPMDGSFTESNQNPKLNHISQYHLHLSICQSGFYSSKSGSDLACVIPILPTSLIGDLIQVEYSHPVIFNISTNMFNSIHVRLTKEDDTPITTNENFYFHLELFTYD